MMYSKPRKPLIAVLLSLFMPGLGHTYCGQLVQGSCLLVLFCLLPLTIARLTVLLPEKMMLAGTSAAVLSAAAVYLFALIDSFKKAGNCRESYHDRSYNKLLFYCSFWLVGFCLMLSSDSYLKASTIEAYKIVNTSMEPTVLQGDYVLADKTAYRKNRVLKNDIIIAVYPDDRSKVLIRRIKALPGEQVLDPDGTLVTVPHGSVMVEGTGSKSDMVDSRSFGPLDMRDIVGKVVQIYFSKGNQSIRWHRIGTVVNPPSSR